MSLDLDSLKDGISGIANTIGGLVKENPVATAVGVAGATSLAVVGGVAIAKSIKKRKTRKTRASRKRGSRIKHTKRGWKQDRKRRSKQKWEVAYQKRKKRRNHTKKHSSKRRGKVYYARKTGQPYIILSSGKAKFIKGKRRK